ncbi:MAG: preprotein translocase subunit SecG [Parcubacteria group bacterium]|nr:preprotein translocase subunit SecG [Parcubacteria group bacterium]
MMWLKITQLVVAVMIIAAILLQPRGMGLGSAFGGEGSLYYTRRGLEKVLFIVTIVLIVLFVGLVLTSLRG